MGNWFVTAHGRSRQSAQLIASLLLEGPNHGESALINEQVIERNYADKCSSSAPAGMTMELT